ncbi:hypothetical protein BTJ40_07260 [Microbulbifer sp. A4B17]|uniref:hypothetical protein n=1 Tax=Microbulbifer sp. A4B17 TaxID=359370 RepID=UPI000D52EFD3|nr:hypothetical protein [Microbulbifer sp. A4B17]AWF80624.1 hypothetical protein BTJ40_07260 [Microbulbifer sp. A4B17]
MDTPRSVLFNLLMCTLILSDTARSKESEPLPEDFLFFLEEWVDDKGDVLIPEDPELAQGSIQLQEDASISDVWLGGNHD